MQQYGGEMAYAPVRSAFDNIYQLRLKLDYSKYNNSLCNDPNSCGIIEKDIIEYLRYLFLLDSRFKIERNNLFMF